MKLGRALTRWVRDLPLGRKVLLPFLVLILLLGSAGTFFLVRGLTDRANEALTRTLTERSLAARSAVHDRELYVRESASFAANLQGVASAVQAADRASLASLMQSVLALKTDLTLLAVVNPQGEAIAQFSREQPGEAVLTDPAASWASSPLVAPVLASPGDASHASFIGFGDRPAVALATTICGSAQACTPVGAIVVGVDAGALTANALEGTTPADTAGVALYDGSGRLVAASGRVPGEAQAPPADGFVRRQEFVGNEEVASLYSPLQLQGERAGSLAVWIPTRAAFASVRSAGVRIALVMLAAMVGVVAIGAGLSRFLLAQVRTLVATNRALGSGDLTARAPVLGRDELGELAAGVNQMAEALQESHETLEARVRERTAEVERLLRERTDFFTAVSHEFRTPLAIILGQAEMLSDPSHATKPAWYSQAGPVLRDAAGQLLDFVNDILEISKADVGRIELNLEDVRADALLRSLRPAIERLAASGDLRASVTVPRRLPEVRADVSRLRQVVLDLVDNAVKYTPAGGEVRVTAAAAGSTVEILVTDTGVGIPPEEGDRLFEPFYRVKGTRTQNGQPSSGLGLALAKRLVEAQGGFLRFDSTPGAGTTFIVGLPAAVGDHDAA